MRFENKAPGVYVREVLLQPDSGLPTAVPAFIGFAYGAVVGQAQLLNRAFELHRKDEFDARFNSLYDDTKRLPGSYLADAVAGFFLNGGRRCFVVLVEMESAQLTDAGARQKAWRAALDLLAPLDALDLIAVPDCMTLRKSKAEGAALPDLNHGEFDLEAIADLQRDVLDHCRTHTGRMAILDAPRRQNEPGDSAAGAGHEMMTALDPLAIIEGRNRLTLNMAEPVNGALYYPWIETTERRWVPPCGHIAGIYARSDARTGVYKAPANEEVRGAVNLDYHVDNPMQGGLNEQGINCLRAFPGRGIRVWGARTLSRDANWRYINVRRLFLTLGRWIEFNMGWTNFEPSTPRLWLQIKRELNAYLSDLWAGGALAGQTAEEAFYVKCDEETNPPEAVDAGHVITEIGLAARAPAEFIVINIVHHTGVEPQ
ncbi:MAG TPA: phage tail sheath subtilisin-like domain-containing protein [Blastocatellia bacterium]